jgi:hypothetical protein
VGRFVALSALIRVVVALTVMSSDAIVALLVI